MKGTISSFFCRASLTSHSRPSAKDILEDLGVDPYSVHTSQQLYDIAKRISEGGYKDVNGNPVIPAQFAHISHPA